MRRKWTAVLLCILITAGAVGCAVRQEEPRLQTDTPPVPAENTAPDPGTEPAAETEPEPDSEPAPPPQAEDFVLAADYVPDILEELRYAAEDNFTGQIIYDFDRAWLRYGTVQKLAAAQAELVEQGYSLKIWDAFRPVSAQFTLWEVCPDPVYVADPNKGYSSHSRGNTVDVTLVYADGGAVEMPTDFDDFTALADRDYSDVAAGPAASARLLEEAMTGAGFVPYSGEWWHFSDSDSYPVEESFSPGGGA